MPYKKPYRPKPIEHCEPRVTPGGYVLLACLLLGIIAAGLFIESPRPIKTNVTLPVSRSHK
ncbi:MAG: hypothetical protein ABIH03_05755 [Pseudomonadota bacterium]